MTDFIGEYMIDTNICDKIIEYHQKSDKKHDGYVGFQQIIPDIKQSTDVAISFDDEVAKEYFNVHLHQCLEKYLKTYMFAEIEQPTFRLKEKANIQYYPPGGGFKLWHYEHNANKPKDKEGVDYYPYMAKRHLVFMTYLNTVTDEGETEFFYQRRYIQPRKGLTLIWPAQWTHAHKGVPSQTQEKWIITGWYSYAN